MQLTPSQSKALGIERHLAIMANAGSGKTRVLVKRYVDLFERNPDLATRNVAAITFTDSSAAELRMRISEEIKARLEERRKGAEGGTLHTQTHHRLHELRDSLSNAFIGTIHSFASRMLRAYPVEANIDASFTLLTGADQRLFVEEAIDRVFYSALELAYEAKDEPPVLHLFRTLGRSDVTGLIRTLLANRSRSATTERLLLSKTDDEILAAWRAEFEQVLHYPTKLSTKALIESLMSFSKNGIRGTETRPFADAYLISNGFFESVSSFFALGAMLITDNGTLHSQRIDLKKLPAGLDSDVADFIAWHDSHESLLKACPSSEKEFESEHREYIFLLRATFALYDRILEEYTTNKMAYGLLDFDDLILSFKKLLDDPRIRAELSEQFLYVMIDEYQDTDENQFELVRLLTENFSKRNNLTIVGDPKQSIYTFRNADASIFRQTREAIVSQELTSLAIEESLALLLSPEEERGEIALRESFRMTAGPLAIVNRLFRMVMRTPGSEGVGAEEVEYSDLVQGRKSELAGSVEWICPMQKEERVPGASSTMRALSTREEENIEQQNGEPEEEAGEAKLIALKIRQIVNDTKGKYPVEADGGFRAAQYDDIAILLRSRTNLPSLEQALRLENIPYTVAKGAGFYSQQGILDISSYLSFLITPADDVALAAILRSPFFALSDVDLFQIAHHYPARRRSSMEDWSFWDQFQNYADDIKAPHLVRTVKQLRENLILAGRTGAALLVEKIYAETGIFATLAAEPNGMQRVMNLEKFLSQARDSDASGFSSLFDFVDRMQYLIEEDENESQADLTSKEGAVRIMTVHSAKGLEFPIVIVPFLQKKFMQDHVRLLDKQFGLHLKYPDSDRQPLIAELIRLRARHSRIAEEKRIFYVALTRARDHLILSSTIPAKPNAESWLAWLLRALPTAIDPAATSIWLEERIERYNGETQQTSEDSVRLDIPLIRNASDFTIQEREEPANEATEIGPVHLMPLSILHPKGRFSATQFLMLRMCPLKYHLSYVLGMPEEPKLAYDMEADEYSETVRGKLLGQIVHKLLDKIDSISRNQTLDEERYLRELENIFFSLSIWNEAERSQYQTAARKHLANFLRSDLSQEVSDSTRRHREYALQAQLETGDILFGIIDCLYKNPDGIWTVLDYKTDSPKAASLELQQKSRYKFQIGFYAYLVHLLFPDAAQINAMLFYTHSGTLDHHIFDHSDFANMEQECTQMIEEIRRNENVEDLALLDCLNPDCADLHGLHGRFLDVIPAKAGIQTPG